MSRIRNRVKELRSARGWTQQDLANAVVPSLELALSFGRTFGVPTDDIFKLERTK